MFTSNGDANSVVNSGVVQDPTYMVMVNETTLVGVVVKDLDAVDFDYDVNGEYTFSVDANDAFVINVRCSFFDRILHSRMPLDPMHVRLKLLHACDNGIPLGCPLPLTVAIINYVETLKATTGELSVAGALNRESVANYTLTVTVSDGGVAAAYGINAMVRSSSLSSSQSPLATAHGINAMVRSSSLSLAASAP
jgi:hypothetical protein